MFRNAVQRFTVDKKNDFYPDTCPETGAYEASSIYGSLPETSKIDPGYSVNWGFLEILLTWFYVDRRHQFSPETKVVIQPGCWLDVARMLLPGEEEFQEELLEEIGIWQQLGMAEVKSEDGKTYIRPCPRKLVELRVFGLK